MNQTQQQSLPEALAEVRQQVDRINELASELESSLHRLVETANKVDGIFMASQGDRHYLLKHLVKAVGNIYLPQVGQSGDGAIVIHSRPLPIQAWR